MLVFPLATLPLASSYPPNPSAAPFLALLLEGGAGQYLVEIDAYKGGEARSGGLWTLTQGPLADIPQGGGVNVGLVTLRYGDAHWIGEPGDTRQPNVFYEGRVTAPLTLERRMPLLPEEARRVQRQFGDIEIANGDSALDPVLQSYAVDGRRVRVLFGPMGLGRGHHDYGDFGVIADVLGAGWSGDERIVRLQLRDQSYALDLPLQSTLYTGAGGAEGNAENAGKPKPLLFGRARNIRPVLIDPVNLIYHWHDGASFALDDVWERGLAMTPSGVDVADYTALVAQSVAAGEFATCLAASMFKLGSTPAGLITCDARGDVVAGVYVDTFDQIALRLLRLRAGLDSMWINSGSFAGAAAIGGELGFYVSSDERPTAAQAMDGLTGSIAAWWGAARDGRIRASRLTAPEGRTANLVLDHFDVIALEPDVAPVPRWRQKIGYQLNWTVQRGEDLAGAVTVERRQFLAEALRVTAAADGTVAIRHLQALDPAPLPSLFENLADADTLAAHLLALHAPDRRIFRVTVKRLGYRLDLGQFTRLTYPKFGLVNGQTFTVIGLRDDATADETIITIWG